MQLREFTRKRVHTTCRLGIFPKPASGLLKTVALRKQIDSRCNNGESVVALFDLGDEQLLVAQLFDESFEQSLSVHLPGKTIRRLHQARGCHGDEAHQLETVLSGNEPRARIPEWNSPMGAQLEYPG